MDSSEDKIVKGPEWEHPPEEGGLGHIFFEKMRSYGDTAAQIDSLTGEEDPYSSYLRRCVRTAIALRKRGITATDVVSICSFNHFDNSVPWIAALFVGVKSANLDPTISLDDSVFLLGQIRPKLIFAGEEAVRLMEDALARSNFDAEIVVFGKSAAHLEFSSFLEAAPEEKEFRPVRVENLRDTACIHFSSGTTGMPKGICTTHMGLLSQDYALKYVGFDMRRVLGFSSLYWISSSIFITASIMQKTTRLIAAKFEPEKAWESIAIGKATSVFLAPAHQIMMFKKFQPNRWDLSHLRVLLMGGGPVSKSQIEEIKIHLPGVIFMLGYGQTEVGGIGCIYSSKSDEDNQNNPVGYGKPYPGYSMKVVDPDSEKLLGPNEIGEIRFKTDAEMNGYYGQDSAVAWDKDGWMKSGDVGYYNVDGSFYVVDRIKEMLKFQSWHVTPAILEGHLMTHPAVESAVVVGLPHPEDGDHPIGVVVLKKDHVGAVTEHELEKYVEGRVQDRMRLRGGVKIVERINLTVTGKIKRRDLRDMIIRGEL